MHKYTCSIHRHIQHVLGATTTGKMDMFLDHEEGDFLSPVKRPASKNKLQIDVNLLNTISNFNQRFCLIFTWFPCEFVPIVKKTQYTKEQEFEMFVKDVVFFYNFRVQHVAFDWKVIHKDLTEKGADEWFMMVDVDFMPYLSKLAGNPSLAEQPPLTNVKFNNTVRVFTKYLKQPTQQYPCYDFAASVIVRTKIFKESFEIQQWFDQCQCPILFRSIQENYMRPKQNSDLRSALGVNFKLGRLVFDDKPLHKILEDVNRLIGGLNSFNTKYWFLTSIKHHIEMVDDAGFFAALHPKIFPFLKIKPEQPCP